MKNICLPIRYILEQSLLRSAEFYPLGMLCVGSLFRFPWRVQECDGNDYQQNFLTVTSWGIRWWLSGATFLQDSLVDCVSRHMSTIYRSLEMSNEHHSLVYKVRGPKNKTGRKKRRRRRSWRGWRWGGGFRVRNDVKVPWTWDILLVNRMILHTSLSNVWALLYWLLD